jgi:tetratricopeptide (TPR) repeat protein
MARAADHHLSQDEIDEVLVCGAESADLETSRREIDDHLSRCDVCQEALRRSEVRHQALSAMTSRAGAVRTTECPAEVTWRRVAAGLVTEAEANHLLAHAAGCDHCCVLLRRVSEDFADPLEPHEQQTLNELQSSQQQWRRRMARDMVNAADRNLAGENRLGGIREWRKQQLRAPRWVYAVAASLACAAVFGFWWHQNVQNSPNRLLAEAYSQRRPFELRFAGAQYRPLSQVRTGDDPSRFNRPSALLEAEARISSKLAENPESPAWLQAQGQTDLLEGRYEAAIHNLNLAVQANPNSPGLLTDLATAYFLKAQALDRIDDYGAVAELLGRVLVARPDDAVALFNRAITYERMVLRPLAIADWKKYLRVDSSSGWAAEARQHLAALER